MKSKEQAEKDAVKILMKDCWDEINCKSVDPKHVYMSLEWAGKGGFKDGDIFKAATIHVNDLAGDTVYMTQDEINFEE